MKCLRCGQESKKGELVFPVYQTRSDGASPTSSQWSSGFVHVECPYEVVGRQAHAAMERNWERRQRDNV